MTNPAPGRSEQQPACHLETLGESRFKAHYLLINRINPDNADNFRDPGGYGAVARTRPKIKTQRHVHETVRAAEIQTRKPLGTAR